MKTLLLSLLLLSTAACSSGARLPARQPDSFLASGNSSLEALSQATDICGRDFRVTQVASHGHRVQLTVLCGDLPSGENWQ